MELKVEKKLTFHVDYYDLEEFITHHYNPPNEYSFPADMESANDTSHSFELSSDDKLDEWNLKTIEEFKAGKGSFVTRALLRDLCIRGLLEPGCYVIDVCW